MEERGPDYNTANNCLTLDFAVEFKGVDKEYVIIFTCLRESLNPWSSNPLREILEVNIMTHFSGLHQSRTLSNLPISRIIN